MMVQDTPTDEEIDDVLMGIENEHVYVRVSNYIDMLHDEAEQLRQAVTFYLGEGPGDTLHAIEKEYRGIAAIHKDARTPEQTARLKGLASRMSHVATFNIYDLVEKVERLEAHKQLHAGDCLSLSNEINELMEYRKQDDKRTDRLIALVGACHEAIGEAAGSDDDGLAEGIKLNISDRDAVIKQLEITLAKAIEQDYCTICGVILGGKDNDKGMGST